MDMMPGLLFGKVMHRRLTPRENSFRYGIYYLVCPLDQLSLLHRGWRFGIERFSLLSFYNRDHGDRSGDPLEPWIRNILAAHDVPQADGRIVLVTMPRVFGYVFNPVSFWLCYDRQNELRAVLCEVNNTFGETHSYLCLHEDRRVIEPGDYIDGKKFFHVSPFLQREGFYRFRFAIEYNRMDIRIDHYNADGTLQLITQLAGCIENFSNASLHKAFWHYPLITLKAVMLIHWQALRLLARGIRYVPKPVQLSDQLTRADKITKI